MSTERISNWPRQNPGSLSPESRLLTAALSCHFPVLRLPLYRHSWHSCFMLLITPCRPSEFHSAIQEILCCLFPKELCTSPLFSHGSLCLDCLSHCNEWAQFSLLDPQPSGSKMCFIQFVFPAQNIRDSTWQILSKCLLAE